METVHFVHACNGNPCNEESPSDIPNGVIGIENSALTINKRSIGDISHPID